MSVGGGTSRADALLEERRRVLRTALKGEYIRCVFIGHFVKLNHNRYLLRKKNHLKTIPMYFVTNYDPTATKLIYRKKYDPKAYSAEGGLIFDAAVQRYDLPLSFSRCNICTLQVARTSVHLRGSLQANFHQLHQVQPHRRHPRVPLLPVVLGATSQG